MDCAFCQLGSDRILESDELGLVVSDGYPVSLGHTLVIPRRHLASWFECTSAEQLSLLALLERAQQRIRAAHSPDGFNIGINDGAAAGQTIPHLHIHLIPRYAGDQPDPRGGVRWVLPEKADYWNSP
jgi:diadenosine tetraphosphate (Ap4A) HIT family hydrolase